MQASSQQPNSAAPRIAALAKLPVFWALEGKPVLVAGGTNGCAWKAELLSACGAKVHIYAPHPGKAMLSLLQRGAAHACGSLKLLPRVWCSQDLSNMAMAIADCENDTEAETFFAAATSAGVPVNIIDRPAYCQFQFGSIVNRSPLVISISTDGATPVLAQTIRRRIEAILPASLSDWIRIGASLRSRIASLLPSSAERRLFWERFADHAFTSPLRLDTEQRAIEMATSLTIAPPRGSLTVLSLQDNDIELLTLKAIRALQTADLIYYERGIPDAVLELARREADRIEIEEGTIRLLCERTICSDEAEQWISQRERIVLLHGGLTPTRFSPIASGKFLGKTRSKAWPNWRGSESEVHGRAPP
ncbi:MAG: NAD(P)-dependent oxidoreductase [Phyllobacterium sp.]